MKKILAFSGSNHSKSINQQLVNYTGTLIEDFEVKILDIKDWNIPIYSIDMDPDQTPDKISELIALIQEYDGFIIASPEHNGATPAFFKNIIDWLSRRAKNVFDKKPVFLMSTSPGGGGGANHLKYLIHSLPYQGATVAASFSLPSYYENMKDNKMDNNHLGQLKESIGKFKEAFN